MTVDYANCEGSFHDLYKAGAKLLLPLIADENV
jgi:hypothetical protein